MADVETKNTPASQTLVAATAKKVLARNESRIRFILNNTSGGVLYVRKVTAPSSAVTAVAGTFDFMVADNGVYISDAKEWNGDIWAYSTAGGTITVSESQ